MASPKRLDILLVEDDPHERELTLRAFRKAARDVHLFAVHDGAEALDFLFFRGPYRERRREAPPRLVLLDLRLPKMSGLEVLRQVKANDATRSIPFVILTSSKEDRDVAESYALGTNGYVVKPVDFLEFVRCVSAIGDYWLTCNRVPR